MKTGTEKQIAWAKEIKENMLNGKFKSLKIELENAKKYVDNKQNKINLGKGTEKTVKYLNAGSKNVEKFENAINFVENCEDAIWFIENRNYVNKIALEGINL